MKTPLKHLCLSRSFAVVLDSNNRTFMWGLEGNNIFKNLNNKYVKQMQCGDKFVISLGRDVVKKKKKATKEMVAPLKQEFPSVT